MKERAIEETVRQVLKEVLKESEEKERSRVAAGALTVKDYPLATRRPELIKTASGKRLADITVEAAVKGEITSEDLRITAETLHMQAEVAESAGRKQLARNLRRAAELTRVPDERILEIYAALRPYRSTKQDLLGIAEELERDYGAPLCAALVREAAVVYEQRRRLKGME